MSSRSPEGPAGGAGRRGPMMSREQVASVLGVSEDTVDRLIRDDELLAYKVRDLVRIWRDDLDDYLRRHRWRGPE